ncbi:MAG: DMT family transporter [Ferrovibrionaceae bacterium]
MTRAGRGDVLLLLTVSIWGFVFPISKTVLHQMPPMAFACLRYLSAGLLLLGVLALREKRVAVPWREVPGLTLIGWLGVTVFQMLWANALALTTASKASVLVATSPIFAVLFASFGRQRPRPRAWAGVLIAFVGVVILVNGSLTRITVGGGALAGDLMFIVAAALWTVYSMISPPYLTRLGTLRVSAWSMTLGALWLVPVWIVSGERLDLAALTLPTAAGFAYTVVLGGALAFIWWYEGLRALGPARAIVYSYLIPVIGVIASVALLGEPFGIAHAVGAAVALAGVILARSA